MLCKKPGRATGEVCVGRHLICTAVRSLSMRNSQVRGVFSQVFVNGGDW